MITVYGQFRGYRKPVSGPCSALRRARAAGFRCHLFLMGWNFLSYPNSRTADAAVLYRGSAVFYRRRGALCVHAPVRTAWSFSRPVAEYRGNRPVHVCRYVWSSLLGGAICALRNHFGNRGDATHYDDRVPCHVLNRCPWPLARR